MKKIFTYLSLGIIIMITQQQSVAQSFTGSNQCDVSPTLCTSGTSNPTTQALFDIQFNIDITAAVGSTGLAAVLYNNGEFWVSEWQAPSDTVWRVSSTGSLLGFFNVPNSTGGGIRAMTTDGNFVYASQNSPIIKKLDKISGAVLGTITTSAGFNVRSITFDPTANVGAGGFWISNYDTDIVLVDMNGNTLSSIPATTHTLTGMYGTAFDNNSSAPNKFLWVFNQAGVTGAPLAEVWQIDISTGLLTGVTLEVNAAIGTSTGLAGGICIATGLASQPSLCGLLQDNPGRIIGMELSSATGSEEISSIEGVSIFPIPASDVVTFLINKVASEQAIVRVFDVQGKPVRSFTTDQKRFSVDVKDLSTGLYIVEIQNGSTILSKRIIVQ